MLFSSITFLFYFLPIVLLLYFLIPGRMNTARNRLHALFMSIIVLVRKPSVYAEMWFITHLFLSAFAKLQWKEVQMATIHSTSLSYPLDHL